MKKYILLFIISGLNIITAFSQVADKFLIKASMLTEEKQFDQALIAINQSASDASKYFNKIFADVNYGLKNYEKAIEFYTKAEASANNCQIELARCYAMLGNKAKAKEHMNNYFQQKNKLPVSKIIHDEAFKKLSNDADWQKVWQNADYSDFELKVNQVSSASESGYNDYFNNILDEALRKYPSNPELLYQQSKYFMEKKMYVASLKAINQALSKSGGDKYLYQKSQIELKNNNLKDALTSINEAINRNPFNINYYLARIELNRSLGKTEDVNADVQLIDFCMPESSDVQLSKIKIDADKGNYLNAIDGLNTLIEKDQTKGEYYILRGKLDLKVQRLQDADEDFGMALDLNPVDAEANLGKGIAKHMLEDTATACYYWQKASNEGSREALEYLNKYCTK